MSQSELLARIGASVRDRRRARGWSRRELADQSGVSERFLADIERGRGNPSILRLADIANCLATTVDGLLRPPQPVPESRQVIALLGLRGAGKSSVGATLAERLQRPFLELDARVEQESGLRVGEMFELHGEAFFRRAERQALQALLDESQDPVVLSTGGGLVTERETFDLLRSRAHTVWLRAQPEDHWSRVVAQGDTRPMANDDRAFSNLCAILSERERLYQLADVTVDTSGRAVDAIAEELALRYGFLKAG